SVAYTRVWSRAFAELPHGASVRRRDPFQGRGTHTPGPRRTSSTCGENTRCRPPAKQRSCRGASPRSQAAAWFATSSPQKEHARCRRVLTRQHFLHRVVFPKPLDGGPPPRKRGKALQLCV